MKFLLNFLFLFIFVSYNCFSQNKSNIVVDKFKVHFNSGDFEQLTSLLSENFKIEKSREDIIQLFESIKSNFGNITSFKRLDSVGKDIFRFRLTFHKVPTTLLIILEKSYIIGISQDLNSGAQDENNIYLETNYGKVYGTVQVPKSESKVPVILLVTGSGPTDRNMNQGNSVRTDAFSELANRLAEKGIATVRFDKRGVGASATSQKSIDISMDTYIGDVTDFIIKLKADQRFSKVVVAGHSEGATIGLMASLRTNPSAFISISGYAKDFGSLLESQLKNRLNGSDLSKLTYTLSELRLGRTPMLDKLPPFLSSIINVQSLPYLSSTLKYNSSTEIKKLNIPTLIIGGTSDLQISTTHAKDLNHANDKSHLHIIEGMNHVLKQVNEDITLNQKAYTDPSVPLSNELIDIISAFVQTINIKAPNSSDK